MPSGVYVRSKNIGQFKKGSLPHNKGKQTERVLKKVNAFKIGLPILCKRHGYHKEWRLHSGNNVQCKICSCENAKLSRNSNIFKSILKDAKVRKIGFDLDEEFLINLLDKQQNKCALTGLSFALGFKPSLDRINSDLGYLKDNVQFVIFDVNRMKSNFEQSKFITICKLVFEHSEKNKKKSK